MDKQRVLFLQPSFDTHGPRNIRTANIIEYLKSKYSVFVLCLETYEKYRIIDDVQIIRVPQSLIGKYVLNKVLSEKKLSGICLFISRGLSYLLSRFFFPDTYKIEHKQLERGLRCIKDIDIIIASIVPFSNADFAYYLKGKYYQNAKVILDIGDPFVNNAASFSRDTERMVKYESGIARKADAIVVTNNPTKNHYLEYGIRLDRIKVIPQGALIPQGNIIARKATDEIRMVYAGTFYPKLRESKFFVKAVNHLNISYFKIRFFGPEKNIGFRNTYSDITFSPRIAQSRLYDEYAKADLLLYFDNAYGIQTSGKIYELLAIKKPILFIYSNEESVVRKELIAYENVFFVRNTSKDLILALSTIREKINSLLCNYNVQDFSWENRSESFADLIGQL